MAKVLLNINGEDQNVKIEKMKVKQLKKALKKIQEIINLVENEESTSELISYFLDMDVKPGDEGAALNDALEDKIFIENLLGAFKILFNRIPDEITELLSIVSGIEEEVLDEQDYDTLFDIVQAIIEENDIKAMIERAKQTFFMARNKWGGLKALAK
jgi:hypothetical protein